MQKEIMVYVNDGIYSALTNKEILPCVITWMKLEVTILHEISHRMINTALFHLSDVSK